MHNIVRLSIILGFITLIAAFVLAEIYNITKPRIEEQKLAKTQEALKYVLPDAQSLPPVIKKIPVEDSNGNTLYEKEEIVYYKAYSDKQEQNLIGYAFKAYGTGYSSNIETMVGIDTTGRITRIKIISQKETPGLGALAENNEPFKGKKWSTQQFIYKQIDDLKVDKDGGTILSITGATITSRAITNSIKAKMQELIDELDIHIQESVEEN
jgi:electron transport complex protein RnfG